MRTIFFTLFFATFELCQAQDYSFRHIYQYEGTDSANKTPVIEQTFDSLGNVSTHKRMNYKQSTSDRPHDQTVFYVYKDTLMTQFISFDGRDSLKHVFHYNDKNQLAREEYFASFAYMRRLEEGYTWEKTGESLYTWDERGNRIKGEAAFVHGPLFVYNSIYDSLNRVSEQKVLRKGELISAEYYEYFEGGYRRTYMNFDSAGRHSGPIRSTLFFLNETGKSIREEMSENDVATGTTLYFYDDRGRKVKTVYLDENGKPDITHLYEYD